MPGLCPVRALEKNRVHRKKRLRFVFMPGTHAPMHTRFTCTAPPLSWAGERGGIGDLIFPQTPLPPPPSCRDPSQNAPSVPPSPPPQGPSATRFLDPAERKGKKQTKNPPGKRQYPPKNKGASKGHLPPSPPWFAAFTVALFSFFSVLKISSSPFSRSFFVFPDTHTAFGGVSGRGRGMYVR